MKAGAAVVALLILAALSTGSRDPGMTPAFLFAAAIAVAVSAVSYREGYNAGQRDFEEPLHLRQNRRTRTRWRRWLGYAAIAVPNVFVWASLVWATKYYGAASWLFVLTGVLAVASIGVGAWVAELLLIRPFRYAQSRACRASAPKTK
jgi:hypothetical protein